MFARSSATTLRRAGRTGLVALALTLSVLLAGCGSKLTKANVDKIQPGMTQQQVEDILGPGKMETTGLNLGGAALSASKESWTEGSKSAVVTYLNGKVTAATFTEKT